MSSAVQRAELQSQIWKIANDVRGAVDGWDFKQYVDFYKKETNNNIITEQHIKEIMKIFDSKEDVPHVAKSVEHEKIVENDYNLSVSSYVEAKDTREVVNINELNREIKTTVAKIETLRAEIDNIIAEIEVDA